MPSYPLQRWLILFPFEIRLPIHINHKLIGHKPKPIKPAKPNLSTRPFWEIYSQLIIITLTQNSTSLWVEQHGVRCGEFCFQSLFEHHIINCFGRYIDIPRGGGDVSIRKRSRLTLIPRCLLSWLLGSCSCVVAVCVFDQHIFDTSSRTDFKNEAFIFQAGGSKRNDDVVFMTERYVWVVAHVCLMCVEYRMRLVLSMGPIDRKRFPCLRGRVAIYRRP